MIDLHEGILEIFSELAPRAKEERFLHLSVTSRVRDDRRFARDDRAENPGAEAFLRETDGPKVMPKKLDEWQVAKARELVAEGRSLVLVAAEMSVSGSTICRATRGTVRPLKVKKGSEVQKNPLPRESKLDECQVTLARELVAEGWTGRAIAARLGVSEWCARQAFKDVSDRCRKRGVRAKAA